MFALTFLIRLQNALHLLNDIASTIFQIMATFLQIKAELIWILSFWCHVS